MRRRVSVCAALVYLSVAPSAFGTTLHVPSEYPTIQAAVYQAAPAGGDTVLVAAGTYTGPGNQNIELFWTSVTLLSESGPELTVLDPTGTIDARGFRLFESWGTRIEGFTIRGGYATFAGAIWCRNSALTLVNCRFFQNLGSSGPGGAILSNASTLSLIDCVLAKNYSIDWGGYGGAIFAEDTILQMNGCTVSGNDAVWGSQIDLFGSSHAEMERTVVSFGTSAAVGCEVGSSSTADLSCCDVFGNSYGNWTGCIASQYGHDGNFSANPFHCDLVGLDYRLRSDSPCLPSGNSCGVLVGALGVGCGVGTGVDELMQSDSWGRLKARFR